MTKITAQPKLNSERDYLEAFVRQTLRKDQGPWIMHDPDDGTPPKGVARGLVLFYNGEVSGSDDMGWSWGGGKEDGDYCIAAFYPLEVVDDNPNPFLYWDGSTAAPPVSPSETVEVIFRDKDRRTDIADEFVWLHENETWDIVAYRKLPESPLKEGVWHSHTKHPHRTPPSRLLPDTQVKVLLRDGYETGWGKALTFDWSVDPSAPTDGDIVAFKIKS